MNNRILIVGVVFFTLFISCNNVEEVLQGEEKKESKYCVNYLHSSPDSILLPENDLSVVKTLFAFNQIDDHSLQFYYFNESLGYHVKCNQFVNGLKIFRENVIFHFRITKQFSSLSGNLVTQIDLDTVPSMAEDLVIEKYLEELDKDDFFNWSSYMDSIKQGCFDVEFGYFDLNAFMGIEEPNYIKAWKVNQKGKAYPHAYVNDMTSTVITYDNGVRY